MIETKWYEIRSQKVNRDRPVGEIWLRAMWGKKKKNDSPSLLILYFQVRWRWGFSLSRSPTTGAVGQNCEIHQHQVTSMLIICIGALGALSSVGKRGFSFSGAGVRGLSMIENPCSLGRNQFSTWVSEQPRFHFGSRGYDFNDVMKRGSVGKKKKNKSSLFKRPCGCRRVPWILSVYRVRSFQ